MRLRLSDLEIEILRKLVNGEAVSLSSQQRVRLELAGMIREGPNGVDVTLTGRNLAREKATRGERHRGRTRGQRLAGPPRSANALSAQINLLTGRRPAVAGNASRVHWMSAHQTAHDRRYRLQAALALKS